MLIELQEPFKSLWRKGYISILPNQRKYVSLYNSDNEKTIISYARYLMCVYLGYVLSSDLEVDHINDDKTDDRLENLQVLTAEQNKLKEHYRYLMEEQICYGFHCACCETPFLITEREWKKRLHHKVELAFCSRSCANIYHSSARIAACSISDEAIASIRNLRLDGLSSYKIAEITNISRNTVMKYW